MTAEGSLASSFHWQQLQPLRGSMLEGVARLPRQLLGSDSAVPTTTDAAKNARHTNDILRRLKELGERMRQEYQPPTTLPEDEIALRVRRRQFFLSVLVPGGGLWHLLSCLQYKHPSF